MDSQDKSCPRSRAPPPPRPRMLPLCWLAAALVLPSTARADVTIDLANAVFDESIGQFCVTQKVCVANPPAALTSAGCAPVLPPGCDCDPEAEDPNSFCASGDVCKDCTCQPPFPPGCECDPEADNPDYLCPADLRCVGCKCQNC